MMNSRIAATLFALSAVCLLSVEAQAQALDGYQVGCNVRTNGLLQATATSPGGFMSDTESVSGLFGPFTNPLSISESNSHVLSTQSSVGLGQVEGCFWTGRGQVQPASYSWAVSGGGNILEVDIASNSTLLAEVESTGPGLPGTLGSSAQYQTRVPVTIDVPFVINQSGTGVNVFSGNAMLNRLASGSVAGGAALSWSFFRDLNGNCTIDPGEIRLPGSSGVLTVGNNQSNSNLTPTLLTLDQGDYILRVTHRTFSDLSVETICGGPDVAQLATVFEDALLTVEFN